MAAVLHHSQLSQQLQLVSSAQLWRARRRQPSSSSSITLKMYHNMMACPALPCLLESWWNERQQQHQALPS